jgi:agmatine deiminase
MLQTLSGTPRADGFRMPGEFEPHAGCWMLWPERPDNWRDQAKPAQQAFAAVAAAIARFEPVTVGASTAQLTAARALLPAAVRIVELRADDAWMRDVGPTFVVNAAGSVRGIDWRFNAWGGHHGGLYASWQRDEAVARQVLALAGVERYAADFVLEGGAIHVDGEGTLLTTEECLLHPNRNPHLSRAEIEARLRDYLNVERIIWLGRGVYNDETDGHVDNLCCFVRPGVVLLTWTDDPADPQYAISRDAYARLAAAVDARGRRLEIHTVHQPGPLTLTATESAGLATVDGTHPRPPGLRLAASYVNFYMANGGIVAPTFGGPHDDAALDTLARLFPDRTVVGVPAREILLGGGNIHCITQQQPA